jgi:hypothetical protein
MKIIIQRLRLIILSLIVISFIVTVITYYNSRATYSDRSNRVFKFRQIAGCLHSYFDSCFCDSVPNPIPDNDSDIYWVNGLAIENENSWRFYSVASYAMGGYDQVAVKKSFDIGKPWYENPNVKVRPPDFEFCWTGEPSSESYYWTNIMTLKGKDTITDLLKAKRKIEWDELRDLIVLVEVSNSKVHWGCPGDLDVENLPKDFLKGTDGKGLIVMFADSIAWYISCDVPWETLKHFLVATDLKNHSRDIELKPYTRVPKY